jgi:hypothetical protein
VSSAGDGLASWVRWPPSTGDRHPVTERGRSPRSGRPRQARAKPDDYVVEMKVTAKDWARAKRVRVQASFFVGG